MPDKIIRPMVPEECGTCEYGHSFREGLVLVSHAIECFGVPPTPVMMGAGPGGAAVGLMRPRLPKETPRCALWALKKAAVLEGAGRPM